MATASDTETAPDAKQNGQSLDKPRRGRPPKAKPDPDQAPPEGDAAKDPPRPPADTRKRLVRVQASILREALKDVTGLVRGRSEIPILSHVLLQAGPGSRIVLTATDLDAWAVRDCACEKPNEGHERGFSAALPAKPFEAILKELDGEAMVTLTLDTDASDAELQQAWKGQAVIAAGRSTFRLNCLPPAGLPLPKPFQAVAAFELHCGELEGDFARVEHAISNEETRYYLNGVYWHVGQEEGEPGSSSGAIAGPKTFLYMVTTDGHRLARLRLDPPDGATSFPPAIVRKETVALLDKLLAAAAKADGERSGEPSTVLVEIDGEEQGATLRFSLPAAEAGCEITVTAKSIDGTFPAYQKVIPAEPALSAIVARAPLIEAVRRVGVLASDKTRCVKAVFADDRIALSVTTPEVGEAREEVPCAYEGPEVTIGFNGQFWREALAALACEDVSIAFDQDSASSIVSPVLLRATGQGVDPDALVQVLMPMRV